MSAKKASAGFEEKLEMLEALVAKMENGGLKLEELMDEYVRGMSLSKELTQELDAAQAKMLVLKNGELSPSEPADAL